MSGLELISTVHELEFSPRPVLTMCTSHDSEEVYKRSMEAGADAFLAKGQSVHFQTIHVLDLIKKIEAEGV